MKKFLYYLAIAAAFILAWTLCVFACAFLNLRLNYAIGIIMFILSSGASTLTAVLLKDKLNPSTNANATD